MNKFKMIYRFFVGATVSYTTFQLLQNKSNELATEGGLLNACTVGAGQMGLALAAGAIAADTITKNW